ncbi:flagellar hook-length control protein FliK [Bosea sp. AAP35]|uniref:flagellar hook-length control protein FliK n=1 Tax=Bosea sp. AAP35 TaxID=1523417 RepID=UPI0018D0CAD3|nr:flagellar hook-length control protein FliK [Bosea sp. AAP35]
MKTEPAGAVEQAAGIAPSVPPALSNLDIVALVSIANAAQADGQQTNPSPTGPGETEAVLDDSGAGEASEILGAAEPKAESVGELPAPVGPMLVNTPAVPGATLPIAFAMEAGPAEGASVSNLPSGTAAPVSTLGQPQTSPAQEPNAAMAAGTKPGAVATAEAGSASPASDIVASPGVPTTTSAEVKPSDVLQQGVSLIDLSGLNQQAARPESPRLLTMPEPIAASGQVALPGQGGHAESQPTPLHVLPIEIGLRALAGARQFDIRLDPGELGRVDVNLSIADNGEVTAKMVVDRVETLHLLQRDSRMLERAFEQAGLKPSDAGVDISLRDPADQSGFRQSRQDEPPQRPRMRADGSQAGEDMPVSVSPTSVVRYVRLGGVDLSI